MPEAVLPADQEVVPWDRRPLLIALAATAVLVLIGIVSGMASANFFRSGPPEWQPPATDSAPSEPAVPPTQASARTITLSGVGDVIMGSLNHGVPPNGGAGMFDAVKSALAADVVMGNLESPLTEDTGFVKCGPEEKDCFQFYLPPSYAKVLADAGFDVVNFANNHANDMGPAGQHNTKAALDAAGVKYTGGRGQITIVEVKGIKVAVLGFSPSPSGQSINDIPAAQELVRAADEQADLVVVQMQGGKEGESAKHVPKTMEMYTGTNYTEYRGDVYAFAHAVVDAGADIVFGHGPHVMRGMEFYKGRLIAYSLGNFCGYKTLNSSGYSGVGGVLKVELTDQGEWVSGQLIATHMVKGGLPEPDPNLRALAFVNDLSQADFGPTAARLSLTDGTITPPDTAS